MAAMVPLRFQSTLPMRGGTTGEVVATSEGGISIHPPHAGRDFGIQARTLERWESGVRNPPPYLINLLRIAVEYTMPHTDLTDPADDHG